jgi:hypothetical protein
MRVWVFSMINMKEYVNLLVSEFPVNIKSFFPGKRFPPNPIASLNVEHFIQWVEHGLVVEMLKWLEELEPGFFFLLIVVILLDLQFVDRLGLKLLVDLNGED